MTPSSWRLIKFPLVLISVGRDLLSFGKILGKFVEAAPVLAVAENQKHRVLGKLLWKFHQSEIQT